MPVQLFIYIYKKNLIEKTQSSKQQTLKKNRYLLKSVLYLLDITKSIVPLQTI